VNFLKADLPSRRLHKESSFLDGKFSSIFFAKEGIFGGVVGYTICVTCQLKIASAAFADDFPCRGRRSQAIENPAFNPKAERQSYLLFLFVDLLVNACSATQ